MARVEYWNHNVHYQPVILRAVPAHCGAALEVGCGTGCSPAGWPNAAPRSPRSTATRG